MDDWRFRSDLSSLYYSQSNRDSISRRHQVPAARLAGWGSTRDLDAKIKDANRTVSALELENQLLRSEGARKSARIAQLEDLVASLEDDLRALDNKVRRSLDTLVFRAGHPLSVETATMLDEAVDEAVTLVYHTALADDGHEDDEEWSAADWLASMGVCELISKVSSPSVISALGGPK